MYFTYCILVSIIRGLQCSLPSHYKSEAIDFSAQHRSQKSKRKFSPSPGDCHCNWKTTWVENGSAMSCKWLKTTNWKIFPQFRSSPAVEAALSSSHESWHSQRGSDIEPVQPISRFYVSAGSCSSAKIRLASLFQLLCWKTFTLSLQSGSEGDGDGLGFFLLAISRNV